MNKVNLFSLLVMALIIVGCDKDDDALPKVNVPDTYSFVRDGQSTVSFTGQTTRIKMAAELSGAMKDFSNVTEVSLLEMFRNETATGGDADPFSDAALNSETKSVRSKTADSKDYFSSNATEASEIKADFETWIAVQVSEVFVAQNTIATTGNAGRATGWIINKIRKWQRS